MLLQGPVGDPGPKGVAGPDGDKVRLFYSGFCRSEW